MNNEDWHDWKMLDDCLDYLETHTVKELFDIMESAVYMRAHELYDMATPALKKKKRSFDIEEIVDYCMTNILPKDCDRRNKLMKNIAIYLYNKDYSPSEIKDIDNVISSNCPGRKKGEILSWIPWCRQKKRNINMEELEDVARQVCGG